MMNKFKIACKQQTELVHHAFQLCLGYGALLLYSGVIAKLLVSSKLNLVIMLFSFAFCRHALQELDHLLHRCHPGSGHYNASQNQSETTSNLHCAYHDCGAGALSRCLEP